MKFDYSRLLMKIEDEYQNTFDFSKDLGISIKELDNKLFNRSEWTSEEIAIACDLLNIDLYDADIYFFTPAD